MLDLLTDYSRTKLYAARVSYAADDAHRPLHHGFAAAVRAATGTDGHGSILVSRHKRYAIGLAVICNMQQIICFTAWS